MPHLTITLARDPMAYPPVLSFGAGVNSTALAILLVNEGWRGHIVFSDTGTEWPDTYCFMDYFEREWLKPSGLQIERLGAEWRSASRCVSLLELCEQRRMIPVGNKRWCTTDYKRHPLGKWMSRHGYERETEMLGIAADESWRMATRVRPLCDRGIDRDGCVKIIQAEGLDVPRKSGCYICPFQRDSQWRELWQRYPELFARAEALEIDITRNGRKKNAPCALAMDGKTTLAQRRLRYESQMGLLDPVDMDELLEYRPCVCHL